MIALPIQLLPTGFLHLLALSYITFVKFSRTRVFLYLMAFEKIFSLFRQEFLFLKRKLKRTWGNILKISR